MECSQGLRRRKATTTRMFAALDLHERSIQCVLKDDEGKIVKESKLAKDVDQILEFLGGTEASVVMESGYNHQYIHDLLKEKGYKVQELFADSSPPPHGQSNRPRKGERR